MIIDLRAAWTGQEPSLIVADWRSVDFRPIPGARVAALRWM